MLYRKFGRLDHDISVLGFGCMRLPIIGKDMAQINEPEAVRLIRHAIDSGINYLDTAYFYHNGTSETFLGRALQDGYREKVMIADKLPPGNLHSSQDFDRILNEQLARLGTDHIDFYLMHGLNRPFWEKSRKLGYDKFLEKALADGRIRHTGFSFHDAYPLFTEIVDAFPWDFCQIQYNYLDTHFQAGEAGLDYAYKKGLAVVIMEPVKGGKLARKLPPTIQEMWTNSGINKTPAELALRWVWNDPRVTTVLSGMTTDEQLEENLCTADMAEPNTLTAQELAFIRKLKEAFKSLIKVDCTTCGYCQPCPAGVQIFTNFELYNNAMVYKNMDEYRFLYKLMMYPSGKASDCTECGLCEEKCPQGLSIRKYLKEIRDLIE